MPDCVSRIAIGSRAQVALGEERCYGVPVPPTRRMDFTGESIQGAQGTLISAALNPSRAITNINKSTTDVNGDLNYELNSTGFGVMYRHALGDSITLLATDGGIRAQLGNDASIGSTVLTLRPEVNVSWPTAGLATVVSRDTSFNLVQDQVRWTGKTDGTSLTGVTSVGVAMKRGDRLFLTDSTAYVGVYTHYMESGRTLPTSLTVEVGRDVAFFTYTGMRVAQITETFNAQEYLTGTVTFMGRAEAVGALIGKAVIAGDTTVMLKPGTFLLQDGTGIAGFRQRNAGGTMLGTPTYTLQVEGENDITYVGYSLALNGGAVIFGIPPTGAGSITKAHAVDMPIAPQISAAETVLVPPTTDPLTSFQAGVYAANVYQEVLSATWTLNNNLFDGKFQLGDRYRAMAPEQRREVTGSMNMEFDDLVMYTRYTNSKAIQLEFRVVDDGANGQIGTTGVYRQIHYIFPKIKLTGTTPNAGGPDVITYDGPFQAMYDIEDDEPEVIMIIVNSSERDPYGV